MADHNELGAEGERIALRYLQSKSYAILETNWKDRAGELDIIAREGNEVVIVEVKTRTGTQIVDAERAITRQKQARMIKLAHRFILLNAISAEVRFDVLIIVKQAEEMYEIRHIPDAFYPLL
ncbi:MAG TPA: YraN family protein [Bacteroidia bacterium]|jgi:putative endonuclease|nr:YraN family protein [Bacteroidia bacterium]